MAVQAQDPGLQEFELARKRAEQQNNAQVQAQKDALKRRAAAQGNLASGSFIKQEQRVGEAGAERLQTANEAIDAAKNSELARRAEVQAGRDFARSEREAGQGFAAEQAGLQRGFMTQERLGTQEFSAAQADLQRKYLTGERLSSQEFAEMQRLDNMKNANWQAGKARELQKNQFAQQMSFAKDQLTEEQWVNRENVRIANEMMNKKDFMDSLFPEGGNFTSVKGIGTLYGEGLGRIFSSGMYGGGGSATGGALGKLGL